MNLPGIWHLGLRYLRRNRIKTALLTGAFALVWLLPAAIAVVVDQVEHSMRARAAGTPLLLGRSGSPLELVFNGIYFTKPDQATLPVGQAREAGRNGLAEVIPVHARFSAQGHRIVGTTLDYFRFRGLTVAQGRGLLRLGECTVGSRAAAELGVGPGDALLSSPESLFDLAGVYPLKMRVVGVHAPTGTPDDSAVFVDLRTAWIIEGLGHGHVEAEESAPEERLENAPGSNADARKPSQSNQDKNNTSDRGEPSGNDDAGTIRLNASVVEYNEITPENASSFHFHGDPGDNPVTAAIVLPRDAKGQALLKGRYADSSDLQLVSPGEEMDELFATVFSVQRLVTWILVATGLATLLIGALVFLLSHRLRRREFESLRNLGADPATLRALVVFEAAFVVIVSLLAAAILLGLVILIAPVVIRSTLG